MLAYLTRAYSNNMYVIPFWTPFMYQLSNYFSLVYCIHIYSTLPIPEYVAKLCFLLTVFHIFYSSYQKRNLLQTHLIIILHKRN